MVRYNGSADLALTCKLVIHADNTSIKLLLIFVVKRIVVVLDNSLLVPEGLFRIKITEH